MPLEQYSQDCVSLLKPLYYYDFILLGQYYSGPICFVS